jgi:hypothetical protein
VPQETLPMPFAHVNGTTTLAGRATAVNMPTHHFTAAEVVEIIWDTRQKENQMIDLD